MSTLTLASALAFIDWLDTACTVVTLDLQASELLLPLLPDDPSNVSSSSAFVSVDPASVDSISRAILLWLLANLLAYLVRIAAGLISGCYCVKDKSLLPVQARCLVGSLLSSLLILSTALPPSFLHATSCGLIQKGDQVRFVLVCLGRLLQNVSGGVDCISSYRWVRAMEEARQRDQVRGQLQSALLAGLLVGVILPLSLRLSPLLALRLAWRIPYVLSAVISGWLLLSDVISSRGKASTVVLSTGRTLQASFALRVKPSRSRLSSSVSPLPRKSSKDADVGLDSFYASDSSVCSGDFDSDIGDSDSSHVSSHASSHVSSEQELAHVESIKPMSVPSALSFVPSMAKCLFRVVAEQQQVLLVTAVCGCGLARIYLGVSLGGAAAICLVSFAVLLVGVGDVPTVLAFKQMTGEAEDATVAVLHQRICEQSLLLRECTQHLDALDRQMGRLGAGAGARASARRAVRAVTAPRGSGSSSSLSGRVMLSPALHGQLKKQKQRKQGGPGGKRKSSSSSSSSSSGKVDEGQDWV